jgi:beta-galactosidase GanA
MTSIIRECIRRIWERRVARAISFTLVMASAVPGLRAQSSEMPRLEKDGSHYHLLVDGRPFYILGAQVHNSSGWPNALEASWPVLHAVHCNTVMVPVYWEAIEPKQGVFDFATVDADIQQARAQGLRLTLSWFGTWKNGAMTYVPSWVKENPSTYPLMLDSAHNPVEALSPMSDASREADRTAFAAFMRHLKQLDGIAHTVILIQVENEAGVLGTDRDYSGQATASFHGPVPREVLASMNKQASPGSTWTEVFAERAPEAFTAYYTARYMDSVAEAGKAIYPLPMYINVWPREQPGLLRPGFSSPSGGAVAWLLDMWKSLAPHIDIIAPDIYDENEDSYRDLLALYNRPDNPLLVPETGGSINHAKNMFLTFASINSLGISAFGVDGGLSADDLKAYKGWASEIAMNYALFGPAASLWRSLSDAGHMQAAIEEEGLANPTLTFDDFDVAVRFGPVLSNYGGPRGRGNPQRNGRVLVGQLSPDEFLIAGMNANIILAPRLGATATQAMLVRVEEGHFDAGAWHMDRLLNGDETAFGVTLPGHGQTLKVKVRAY